MGLRFGIHVGHLGGPLDELRRLWRFADRRGFDWFSTSDHFQESPPQGGDGDCFESVGIMAAAAADTTQVRIGCLVFCVNYRNPGLLAKSICTIDHLSGGRAEVGIGAAEDDVGGPRAPEGVGQRRRGQAGTAGGGSGAARSGLGHGSIVSRQTRGPRQPGPILLGCAPGSNALAERGRGYTVDCAMLARVLRPRSTRRSERSRG